MKKIAVMCDSSADISHEEAQRLGIHVVRMPVIIDDVSYIEHEECNVEMLSNALDNNRKVATSQVSPGRLEMFWDEVLEEYDQILFLPISDKLSGSYATAKQLAKEEKYLGKVVVVYPRYVSYAQIELCLEMKELIRRGVSLEEIADRVENEIYQDAFIVPYDLNTFKNSGRVSPAVAALAGLLKIQVVLHFDHEGKIEQIDKVRTLPKAYQVMLKHALDVENPEDYYWGIVHSDYEAEALKLKEKMETEIDLPVPINVIRTVIRAHTGNKTIAIYRINKLIK